MNIMINMLFFQSGLLLFGQNKGKNYKIFEHQTLLLCPKLTVFSLVLRRMKVLKSSVYGKTPGVKIDNRIVERL